MSLVDTELILSIVDGDAREARNLTNVFFDSARQQLDRMAGAVGSGDRQIMSRAAHQMAGAAGTCGFSELERHFREIELAMEQGAAMPDRDRISRLKSLVCQAEAEAQAAFPEGSAQP